MFLTLEGIEGSGKTTHVRWMVDYLRRKGVTVCQTREPGGTPLGEKLRALLLSTVDSLESFTEILLFAADRAQHVTRVIQPALDRGEVVVCDRYVDSTSAYQMGGRGLPPELVENINRISSNGILPDLTIILDCAPEVGLARARGKRTNPDRFESEAVEFYQRVRVVYLEIARAEPNRVKVVKSDGDLASTEKGIQKIIEEWWQKSRP